MPAVSLIESPVSDSTRHTFDQAHQHFGMVPNLVKALASNAEMCTAISGFLIQSLREGRVSWAFKELVILKTLRSIGSYYSYGAHERLAAELGNSPARIGDLNNSLWRTSPEFTDGERAVLALIEQIAIDANDVSPTLWDELRTHWDAGQLVELTALITTFVMIGRTGDTLGVSEPHLFAREMTQVLN
jgi:alkylhydroperoxidase family enzyme